MPAKNYTAPTVVSQVRYQMGMFQLYLLHVANYPTNLKKTCHQFSKVFLNFHLSCEIFIALDFILVPMVVSQVCYQMGMSRLSSLHAVTCMCLLVELFTNWNFQDAGMGMITKQYTEVFPEQNVPNF